MRREYDQVLFDLDGTLTDPLEGITKSVQYALDHFGIHVEDNTTLSYFIGPPLVEAFMEHYGFTREKAVAATEKYRERFAVKGIHENIPYEGILELLRDLKAAGKTVLLATSKPQVFAEQILRDFGFYPYFDAIGGSLMDGTRTHKDEVMEYILTEAGVQDRSRALMVGDRKFDVEGARKVGVDCIGVLYGYGSAREMAEAGAWATAATVEDLRKLLLG